MRGRRRARWRLAAPGGSRRSSLPLALATIAPARRRDARATAPTCWSPPALLGLVLTLVQGFGVGLRGWNWRLARRADRQRRARRRSAWASAAHAAAARVPADHVPRPGRPRLVPGRRLRRLVDRHRRRADRAVRVLSRLEDPVSARSGQSTATSRRASFVAKFTDRSIWGLDCLYGPLRCGVAWNTLFLGVLVGVGTHRARPRLRADRDAHRASAPRSLSACSRCCRSSRRPSSSAWR